MAAHFKPVVNANYRLVAPPPTRRTAIGGYPKVASYDMLGEQLHYSNPVEQGKETLLNYTFKLDSFKSYEIAMLIAKNKKSHNIGKSPVKLCITVAAELVLGKDKAKMLSQIALPNDTVKGRIDELSQDIKDQILDQIKESPFLAIQCDEMTDIGSCFQLLLYARFLSVNTIKEEMLFCHQMKGQTTSAEIFNVVANFFQENKLSWESLAGACMDGAPAMTGLKSGFIKRVKEK